MFTHTIYIARAAAGSHIEKYNLKSSLTVQRNKEYNFSRDDVILTRLV